MAKLDHADQKLTGRCVRAYFDSEPIIIAAIVTGYALRLDRPAAAELVMTQAYEARSRVGAWVLERWRGRVPLLIGALLVLSVSRPAVAKSLVLRIIV